MLEFLVLTCLNCSSWEQEELFIYTSIKSSKYNRKVYKIAYSPIGLPASLLISPNIGNLTPICLLSIVIGPTICHRSSLPCCHCGVLDGLFLERGWGIRGLDSLRERHLHINSNDFLDKTRKMHDLA